MVKGLEEAAGSHYSFYGFGFFGHSKSTFGALNIARDFSVPLSGMQDTSDAHPVSDKPFMSKVIRSAFWNFGPD